MHETKTHRFSSPRPATHAQIAALAYELWLGQKCPRGRDVEIWLEAERQLDPEDRAPRPPDRAAGSAPSSDLDPWGRPLSRASSLS